MLLYFIPVVIFLIIILLITLIKTNDLNRYTTFLGSNYSFLIEGELTKAHVQQAENVIGTIKGVQIGTAVTSIGNVDDTESTSPFYQKIDLTSLIFKGATNCTMIGAYCFRGTGLTSLVLPAKITTLSPWGFASSQLISVDLSNTSVTTISNLFYGCVNLVSIIFPYTLITIGTLVIHGSINLKNVTIPASVSTIDIFAFSNVTLTSVTFNGNGSSRVISVNQLAFIYPETLYNAISGGSLEIPADGETFI